MENVGNKPSEAGYPLVISFGGEDEIEAKTLSDCLKGIVDLVELAAVYTNDADVSTRITIQQTQKGSFAVLANFFITIAPLFIKDKREAAKDILYFINEAIRFKIFLNGKKPKKKTENQDGTVNITNTNDEMQNLTA